LEHVYVVCTHFLGKYRISLPNYGYNLLLCVYQTMFTTPLIKFPPSSYPADIVLPNRCRPLVLIITILSYAIMGYDTVLYVGRFQPDISCFWGQYPLLMRHRMIRSACNMARQRPVRDTTVTNAVTCHPSRPAYLFQKQGAFSTGISSR
jgi:hypothetical protein